MLLTLGFYQVTLSGVFRVKFREKVPLTRLWFASVIAIYTVRLFVFARGSLGTKSKAFLSRGYRLYGSA